MTNPADHRIVAYWSDCANTAEGKPHPGPYYVVEKEQAPGVWGVCSAHDTLEEAHRAAGWPSADEMARRGYPTLEQMGRLPHADEVPAGHRGQVQPRNAPVPTVSLRPPTPPPK